MAEVEVGSEKRDVEVEVERWWLLSGPDGREEFGPLQSLEDCGMEEVAMLDQAVGVGAT